ncbi:sensor histidine kinase [Bacillus mycoides]
MTLLREAYRVHQEQLLEIKTAHAKLQKSTLQSIQYAALTERTRIAREIHDGLGHQMTSLIVQLQALELMLPNASQTSKKTVTQLLKTARAGMAEIRITVQEWTNDEKVFGIIALRGLISQVAANSAIQFSVKEEGTFSDWSENISISIFRILQESITNVIRHSNASTVYVHIQEDTEELSLIISDNGRFTNNDSFNSGFGVKGMVERCKAVGGTCTFSTNEHGGLKSKFTIPLTNLKSI